MPAKNLYEYAVIRVVPRVEREEFFNVGVVLFSKSARFLKARVHLDMHKLHVFSSELEEAEILENLKSFCRICEGAKDGGAIAQDDLASRFRWLTAVRSSSIQVSRPHTGSSTDLETTLDRLFQEQVL